MNKRLIFCACALAASISCLSREYHVSKYGPFFTINAVAQKALPGDTVTVHEGVYREWVDPLRGGRTEQTRILYRAAEGEKVEIKGSEVVKGWKKVRGSDGKLWTVSVPNSIFGTFNPFDEVLTGDWVGTPYTLHLAEVFLNDVSMYEAESMDSLLCVRTSHRDPDGVVMNWFSTVGKEETVITASFCGLDPNEETVEISVRPTCFYPSREGLNYITVRGFIFNQAATKWAAPTAEQIGMVSPHWCKGWIIEDNVVKNSRSSGITLGKEAGTGDNVWTYDKHIDDGHLHYIECIFRALRHDWNKESVGSHIVRNNVISDCGQAGICGAMGCSFSEVYGNTIYNICFKDELWGAEMAGIKFHCAIDTYVHSNVIYRSHKGIWLDWMAQGSRVSSNVIYESIDMDLFYEMNHGPFVVDNNILLSDLSIVDNSEGGAYLHNLIGGKIRAYVDYRYIPYMLDHSTAIKGVSSFEQSDNRFIDNVMLLVKPDNKTLEEYYKEHKFRPVMEGNVGVKDWDAAIAAFYSSFKTYDGAGLGIPRLTDCPYENPDGTGKFVCSGENIPLAASEVRQIVI